MRICNECGHVFETSSFKCEKCDSLDIETIDPHEKIKEEDWVKLLSPSRATMMKITAVILVILIIFIVSLFDDNELLKLFSPLLSLISLISRL